MKSPQDTQAVFDVMSAAALLHAMDIVEFCASWLAFAAVRNRGSEVEETKAVLKLLEVADQHSLPLLKVTHQLQREHSDQRSTLAGVLQSTATRI